MMGNGILDDSRVTLREAAVFKIVFLGVSKDGQAYTEGEYRSFLEQAGLVDISREIGADGDSLITVRKPA